MNSIRWVSVLGEFHLEGGDLVFEGGTTETETGTLRSVGNFLSNQTFGNGEIGVQVEFIKSVANSAAGLILYYQPKTKAFVSATLGGGSLCSIGTWVNQQWTHHATQGPGEQLKPNQPYDLKVKVQGSQVSVSLDEIQVLATDLPFSMPTGHAGIWALGPDLIRYSNFRVNAQASEIFVVMQFTDSFNELYSDVIAPICSQQGFKVVRADETYGPGVIIADIVREITEASIVIADITPNNPNVFWEVGYAHALRKPTILIAERGRDLPFDISPFRTLFYDNTIAGKSRVEEGLRRHLSAIQEELARTS